VVPALCRCHLIGKENLMRAIFAALRKIAGLFVDDGWLAIETLGVVGLVGVIRASLKTEPMLAGAALVLGCFGAFTVSVLSASRNCSGASAAIKPERRKPNVGSHQTAPE
jgi:hypothetical protein